MPAALDNTTKKSLAMKALSSKPKLMKQVQDGLDAPIGSPAQKRAANIMRSLSSLAGITPSTLMVSPTADGQGGPVNVSSLASTGAQPAAQPQSAPEPVPPPAVSPVVTVDSSISKNKNLSFASLVGKTAPSSVPAPAPAAAAQATPTPAPTAPTDVDKAAQRQADAYAQAQVAEQGADKAAEIAKEAQDLYNAAPSAAAGDSFATSQSAYIRELLSYDPQTVIAKYDAMPDSDAKSRLKWVFEGLKSGMGSEQLTDWIGNDVNKLVDTFGYTKEEAQELLHPDLVKQSQKAYAEADGFYGVTESYADWLNAATEDQGFRQEAWKYMASHDQAVGALDDAIERSMSAYWSPSIQDSAMSGMYKNHIQNLVSLRDSTYANYKTMVDKANQVTKDRLSVATQAYQLQAQRAGTMAETLLSDFKEKRTMDLAKLEKLEADLQQTYDRLLYGFNDADASHADTALKFRTTLETMQNNIIKTNIELEKALNGTAKTSAQSVNKAIDSIGLTVVPVTKTSKSGQTSSNLKLKVYDTTTQDPDELFSLLTDPTIGKLNEAGALKAISTIIVSELTGATSAPDQGSGFSNTVEDKIRNYVANWAETYRQPGVTLDADSQKRSDTVEQAIRQGIQAVVAEGFGDVTPKKILEMRKALGKGVDRNTFVKSFGGFKPLSNEMAGYLWDAMQITDAGGAPVQLGDSSGMIQSQVAASIFQMALPQYGAMTPGAEQVGGEQ